MRNAELEVFFDVECEVEGICDAKCGAGVFSVQSVEFEGVLRPVCKARGVFHCGAVGN